MLASGTHFSSDTADRLNSSGARPWRARRFGIAAGWLVAVALGSCTTAPIDDGFDDDDDDDQDVQAVLFVVNDGTDTVTSHDAAALDGEEPALTELNAGAATSLFQPRGIVVTTEDVLFVSRQNGGIVGYEPSGDADGDQPASRVIEGNSTLLNSTISLEYDPATDILFAGEASADDGILVFDSVSDPSFDGDLDPDRMFNPPDRAPSDVAPMTVNAMVLDDSGNLYVADTSGSNLNSSRILVFADAANADGEVTPIATITSSAWDVIDDLAFDAGSLFIVDSSENVFRIDDVAAVDGDITPDATITINEFGASLRGIEIAEDGTGLVSDAGRSLILSLFDIGGLDGTVTPDAELGGSDTELFTPRHMALVEP